MSAIGRSRSPAHRSIKTHWPLSRARRSARWARNAHRWHGCRRPRSAHDRTPARARDLLHDHACTSSSVTAEPGFQTIVDQPKGQILGVDHAAHGPVVGRSIFAAPGQEMLQQVGAGDHLYTAGAHPLECPGIYRAHVGDFAARAVFHRDLLCASQRLAQHLVQLFVGRKIPPSEASSGKTCCQAAASMRW